MTRAIIPAGLLLATACAVAMGPPTTDLEGLTASIFTSSGGRAGTVTLHHEKGEVLLFVFDLRGLPPGPHAVHVHTIGSCIRPDFLSAGPHLDPDRRQHGRDNPAGRHLGDLEDIVVGPDGTSRDTLRFAPLDGRLVPGQIVGGDGSAVVIHEGPDDDRTDPDGRSGARIACGILM
jgi:Cu-Zn family superoxide dismutase